MRNLIWIPKPTEEETIRLFLCHTSYLHKFLKLHISQTKKSLNSRSSHQSCSIGRAVLKKFLNIHRKMCWSIFLIELQALGSVILLKATPTQQHRCFPVNIAKFSRTSFLKKIFEQLPLEFLRLTVNISSYGLVSALNSIVPLQGPLQCLKSSL